MQQHQHYQQKEIIPNTVIGQKSLNIKSKKSDKVQKNQNSQLNQDMIKRVIYVARNIVTANKGNTQQAQKTFLQNEQQLRKMIETHIKPISFRQVNPLKKLLSQHLLELVKEQAGQKFKKKNQIQGSQIVAEYLLIQSILRQQSIATPVVDAFHQIYMQSWAKHQNISKQQYLLQWQRIPYRHLDSYLVKFNIAQQFKKIECEVLLKELTSNLTDNKVQQVCEYYKIYVKDNKYYEDCQKAQSSQFQKFQVNHLIPKLLKSDEVLTYHAVSLIKTQSVFNLRKKLLKQLDPPVGLRLIEALDQSAKDYPKVYEYICRQHYKSILHEHKDKWYVLEDKLSFSKNFIRFYAEQLCSLFDDKTKQKVQILAEAQYFDYQQHQQVDPRHISQSILFRAGLLEQKYVQKMIENPLWKYDFYGNAEAIIGRIFKNQKKQQNQESSKTQAALVYLDLNQEEGIPQKQVFMIDSIQSEQFKMLKQQILIAQKSHQEGSQKVLFGFDTQFRNAETKFDQQGCALMQLCTKKNGYIIDFLKLQQDPKFINFMIDFLTNPKIIKVGHTVQSDMKQMAITFRLPKNKKCQGFIDVCKLFKAKHTGTKYTSLSYMCEVLLGKKLCKYQQRSNWCRRPLKKTQIHYAISDSFACLLCLQKLQSNEQLKFFQQKQLVKGRNQVYEIVRQPDIVYSTKFANLINENKTKFLVDNMLKKLCTIMRNIGIDTQYISVKNHKLTVEMAQNQGRVIITKDTKLFTRKEQSVPIYLIQSKEDSEVMFNQIVKRFNLNLNQFKSLSRCVKCNGDKIQVIEKQQALQVLNFQHEDTQIQFFWRCTKCKQIYWQGNQFKKAKNQFDKIKQN